MQQKTDQRTLPLTPLLDYRGTLHTSILVCRHPPGYRITGFIQWKNSDPPKEYSKPNSSQDLKQEVTGVLHTPLSLRFICKTMVDGDATEKS